MLDNTQNTALLIFAHSDREGANSKKLLSNKYDSRYEIIKYLNKKTLQVAKKSGLTFFIIDEKNQTGNHFGEKLANAFQTVFSYGFDKVIAIGNDCPSLKPEDIASASSILTKNCSVIGPDCRKGAYLIGLTKRQFNWGKFAHIRWQSVNTLSSLIETLGECEFLDSKSDLNKINDLKKVFENNVLKSIKKLILKIIGLLNLFEVTFKLASYTSSLYSQIQKRGPPQPNFFLSSAT